MKRKSLLHPTPLKDKKIPTQLLEWKKNIYLTLYEAACLYAKETDLTDLAWAKK